VHEVYEAEEIYKDVYTTDELEWLIKGQSLMLKTCNGLTVIAGCAHTGLENILKFASKFGEIYGVVGGFHGFSRLEASRGIRLIVSCHCTMWKREICTLYPEACRKCSVGCTIKV
jgi:7,8-dihydropterin-6-yl-methyl-4-(beta-D-ribofuranosyl)aminobenzene 5'-phosphate synthase